MTEFQSRNAELEALRRENAELKAQINERNLLQTEMESLFTEDEMKQFNAAGPVSRYLIEVARERNLARENYAQLCAVLDGPEMKAELQKLHELRMTSLDLGRQIAEVKVQIAQRSAHTTSSIEISSDSD